MNLAPVPATRRRGAELDTALLDATWAELVEHGYAALTFESVAARAGTSRPVLYRRWATKAQLIRAAVARAVLLDRPAAPDTGSLRQDLIDLMHLINERRIEVAALLLYHLGGYFQETGASPQDLREAFLDAGPSPIDVALDRAVARGEVDASRLTPRIRTLPFDLYRHHALMTLRPVPDEVIEGILDEVFLPLVRSRGT